MNIRGVDVSGPLFGPEYGTELYMVKSASPYTTDATNITGIYNKHTIAERATYGHYNRTNGIEDTAVSCPGS